MSATAGPRNGVSTCPRTRRAAPDEGADRGIEPLQLLLRDMPRGPLLTSDQELALARRARGEAVVVPPPGDPRPTPEAARRRIIEQNLGLVISVARHFRGR